MSPVISGPSSRNLPDIQIVETFDQPERNAP